MWINIWWLQWFFLHALFYCVNNIFTFILLFVASFHSFRQQDPPKKMIPFDCDWLKEQVMVQTLRRLIFHPTTSKVMRRKYRSALKGLQGKCTADNTWDSGRIGEYWILINSVLSNKINRNRIWFLVRIACRMSSESIGFKNLNAFKEKGLHFLKSAAWQDLI